MTFDELQQAINNKHVQILPPDPATSADNPIDGQATPSLDEFLTTLMSLRNIRIGRLGYTKLPAAATSLAVNFKPTRFITVRVLIIGKSATTPVVIQFNGDTGTNYLYNVSANNPSVNSITLDNASSTDDIWTVAEIENVRDRDKMVVYRTMRYSGAVSGSGTKGDGVAAWGNKTTQITSIQITPSAGGGVTFDKGSFIEVFGHD